MPNQLALIDISNQETPPRCDAKALTYTAQLASATEDQADFQPPLVQKQIDNIQAVFVDNSANAQPLTIDIGSTFQRLIVPANSQAYLPVFTDRRGFVVTFTSTGGVDVKTFWLNVPMPAFVWSVA